MALERERLASADKRADVVRAAIQASSAADERQFTFQMARLDKDDQHRKETRSIARNVLYGGAVVGAFVILACLGFSFLGDERQAQTAMTFLKTLNDRRRRCGNLGFTSSDFYVLDRQKITTRNLGHSESSGTGIELRIELGHTRT